jgi:EAL domain-containing protein (putative c-di-GMP-specific phosphodiesterase class I)
MDDMLRSLSLMQLLYGSCIVTVAYLIRGIAGSGLEPQYLDLELTESMLMHDIEHAVSVLKELDALGVSLSVDDFGTGYSSLSYLKRFPIDVLKIDRSFVHDITASADDAAIVTAIIAMAHSLDIKVVAEGVETLEQQEFLKQRDCDGIQGYYFSKPLPVEAFTRLLKKTSGRGLYRPPATRPVAMSEFLAEPGPSRHAVVLTSP